MFQEIKQEILERHEEIMWITSDDRKTLATNRLAFYRKFLAEGGPNPYLEPEQFDFYSN